ncbi:hypothetical protein GCM10008919_09310 [Selenomonas dianae]|uniref:Uncharacterized protein n=1 Tax=Selenomonas dianae TaxID=135079 RepID=A0ABP3CK50_9FIRM
MQRYFLCYNDFIGIADKIDPQIGVDFFVRTRRQTGRIAKAMWRIAGTVRAKKMRQDGAAEFISASLGGARRTSFVEKVLANAPLTVL